MRFRWYLEQHNIINERGSYGYNKEKKSQCRLQLKLRETLSLSRIINSNSQIVLRSHALTHDQRHKLLSPPIRKRVSPSHNCRENYSAIKRCRKKNKLLPCAVVDVRCVPHLFVSTAPQSSLLCPQSAVSSVIAMILAVICSSVTTLLFLTKLSVCHSPM